MSPSGSPESRGRCAGQQQSLTSGEEGASQVSCGLRCPAHCPAPPNPHVIRVMLDCSRPWEVCVC